MAANIREEIRRLHRRKQLHYNQQASGGESSDIEAPASPSNLSVASGSNIYSTNPSAKEKPLFTFRQVICFINVYSAGVRKSAENIEMSGKN